ncbi:MAG: HAD family hydrolase, partial [Hyphomicrobiaceae bacterium]
MPMPKLVIFDCDGVLVDTEPPTNAVIATNLARYGLELTVTQCVELFMGGTMASVAEKVREMGYPLPRDWTDEIYQELFARLAEGVSVIPGVLDVLDGLDADAVPYCVGSNGP